MVLKNIYEIYKGIPEMANAETKYTPPAPGSHLCEGFLHWLQRFPDAPALHINDTIYSYKALFELALPVFEALKKHPKERIGVYCNPDVHAYAAILGVSMAGACYVPLNPGYPPARLRQIIRDCGLDIVLVHRWPQLPPIHDVNILDTSLLKKIKEVDLRPFIEQPLAYILHTSGTTGLPKGVPVSKKNVNAFFHYYISEYDFHSQDRFLQPYELSFDVSVFSIFCAWNAGASVHVVKDTNAKYLEIFKTIRDQRITVCSMVPGVLKLAAPFLHEFHFPDLRYSFFSGDALYHADAFKWKQCIPNAQIDNFYGPTETTIVCTRYRWNAEESKKESFNGIVPLGSVFPGMHYSIIDDSGKAITATDITGELCFSGPQVIDAYLNNESPERFFDRDGKTWYKTGDQASLNKQGHLVFHGRNDGQVKINGYRIGLSEIEQAVSQLTATDCKVIAQHAAAIPFLVAFVEGSKLTELELRVELGSLLPAYMIPSKLVFIEAFPKNLNGKTDLNELKKLLHV
jgi:amino acid adenylation domain-containing protein